VEKVINSPCELAPDELNWLLAATEQQGCRERDQSPLSRSLRKELGNSGRIGVTPPVMYVLTALLPHSAELNRDEAAVDTFLKTLREAFCGSERARFRGLAFLRDHGCPPLHPIQYDEAQGACLAVC